ncbi:MAG: hypothetical protein LUC45_05320 [Paraprevotella sp.]|nr:hypothetical protein [Paraprevotella sp.]
MCPVATAGSVGTDGAPSGILMSAQVTLADNCGSKVVDVSLGGTEEHPLHLKADLIHSVSKALVLVTLDKGTKSPTDGDYDASDLADRKGKEYDNPGPEYVAVAPRDVGEVSGGTLYAPYIGWIRKDEVKFIPGGVNKKLYFFPQQNGDVQMPAYKDPNMPLTDFMDFTQSDGKLVAEPKSDYGNEFIFHSGYDLHLQLLDDWMETAEAYDGTLWDNTIKSKDVSARYVNGMYFPENTFSLLDENKAEEKPYADALNAYSGGLPMVTNIHIAARLRPRKFGIPKNFVTKFQEFYNSYIAARTGTEDVRKAFEATLGGLTIQDLEKAGISSWVDHLPMINDHIKSIKDEDLPSGMSSDTKAVIESIADIYDSGSPDTTEYVLTMAQLYKNLWWYDDRHYTSLRFPSNTFLYYSGQTTTDASGKTTVVLPTLCFSADFYLMTADDVAELLGSTTSDSNVEAAWIFIETLKLQSVPHLGGWGYYFTYLDETGVTADYNGVTPYTASEVYRNRYYLINVTQINNAGGSVTDAEYIKTFTSPVNWQYAGKADVNLH